MIIGPNGLIMMGPSGLIASSTDCCDCTDCEPCCIKIESGALIDGKIKILETVDTYSMEVEITTPNNTKLVCGDEEITIKISLYDGVNDLASIPCIIFDPAWQLIGNSPDAEASIDLPGGYLYFESSLTNEYTAVFRLRNCFFIGRPELGTITVIASIPESLETLTTHIDITPCTIGTPCCTMPRDCEPCCWSLAKEDLNGVDVVMFSPPFDWNWNANSPIGPRWEHLEYSNEVWFLFWIKPPDNTKPSLFCSGQELEIGVIISSENRLIIDTIQAIRPVDPGPIYVEFQTGDFEEIVPSFDPSTAVVVGDPETITWTQEKELEYKAKIIFNCDNPGQELISLGCWLDLDGDTLQGPTDPAVAAVILFEWCGTENDEEGCPCGCPCCGFALPENLKLKWTYDGTPYEIALTVQTYECGSPVSWASSGPAGILGLTLMSPGSGDCAEYGIVYVTVFHECGPSSSVSGWTVTLLSNEFFGNGFRVDQPCQLPVVGSSCDIEYTLEEA